MSSVLNIYSSKMTQMHSCTSHINQKTSDIIVKHWYGHFFCRKSTFTFTNFAVWIIISSLFCCVITMQSWLLWIYRYMTIDSVDPIVLQVHRTFLLCFLSLCPRWCSPPVSWGCSMYCWVQSAPCLQRRSVRRWEPAWTAHRGCWLPAAACSSSTHTRTTDEVDTLVSLFTLWWHAHLPLSRSRAPVSLSLSHSGIKGETLSEHLQWVTLSHLLLLLHLPPPPVLSALQQHRAGQRLPDPLQSRVPLPVHPVQLQNHLPLLAPPDRRCQVSSLMDTVSQ